MQTTDKPMSERQAHVAWCKERALEYLDAGDLANAVASMMSDMGKREDTAPPPELMMLAMFDLQSGNADGVRRWIVGFN